MDGLMDDWMEWRVDWMDVEVSVVVVVIGHIL